MVFEIGKYYRHTGGGAIHVITAAKTYIYGWALIAEEPNGRLKPVGSGVEHAVNWEEIKEGEWLTQETEDLRFKNDSNEVKE